MVCHFYGVLFSPNAYVSTHKHSAWKCMCQLHACVEYHGHHRHTGSMLQQQCLQTEFLHNFNRVLTVLDCLYATVIRRE